MRFKKGTKVEVLTQKEVPSGSWQCAEIIGGNGQHYFVKYEGDEELLGNGMVERVSQKAIRPCPPLVDVLQDWVDGDVVEVFHNFSWKMAVVLKVLGCNYLLVRLLGSAIELKAYKFDVRARVCWQDGEWIMIGKASNKCEDMRFRFPSSRKEIIQSQNVDAIVSRPIQGYHVGTRNADNNLESHVVPSRTLKRKQSQIEEYAGPRRKTRVEKRVDMRHQLDVMQELPRLPEKVADVASSREMLHEKFMHPFLTNKVTGCSELILEREKTDGAVGYSRSISLESDEDNSVSSSVGSCSVYGNYSHKLHHVFEKGPIEDNDSQHSDAESFSQLRPEEGNFLPAKEDLTEELHRLELHAYRCTIGALHASGPLSWEQELLLTNLRHSLHISNDEHLKEIRNLVSSSNCIPSS